MKSITHGFRCIKNARLGLSAGKSFKHKKILIRLCEDQPSLDGAGLADDLLTKIKDNWHAGREVVKRLRSRENWRFEPTPHGASKHNTSAEVTFERAVVAAPGNTWANQVPTSSGLMDGHYDKRRAIDLVEQPRLGEFEFIELKLREDGKRYEETPLYAALEILDYGALYVFSRQEASALGYSADSNEILEADRIGLRVLAPRPFYEFRKRGSGSRPFRLEWLQRTMQGAASRLGDQVGEGFIMDFRFTVFPEAFAWQSRSRRRDYAAEMIAARQPLIGAEWAD